MDIRLPYGTNHDDVVAAVDRVIAESGVSGVEASYEWIAEGNVTSDTCTLVTSLKKNIEDIWGEECLPRTSGIERRGALSPSGLSHHPVRAVQQRRHPRYNEDVDIIDVVHAAEIYMLTLCDMLGIA